MINRPDLAAIEYPDSDGKRMAENTLQYEWIVTIKGNIDALFADDPAVFVAGDNLIYPVKGRPKICTAPDVYVAFGRPKGHRGSYKVWIENDIFPQVIFEVLSPGNSAREMGEKRAFYRKYGAEEYFVIDPDEGTVEATIRKNKRFTDVGDLDSFISPRLGIRFELTGAELVIRGPNGLAFQSFQEIVSAKEQLSSELKSVKRRADTQRRRAENAEARAEAEAARAATEAARAATEAARAQAESQARAELLAKLKKVGIDPNSL